MGWSSWRSAADSLLPLRSRIKHGSRPSRESLSETLAPAGTLTLRRSTSDYGDANLEIATLCCARFARQEQTNKSSRPPTATYAPTRATIKPSGRRLTDTDHLQKQYIAKRFSRYQQSLRDKLSGCLLQGRFLLDLPDKARPDTREGADDRHEHRSRIDAGLNEEYE